MWRRQPQAGATKTNETRQKSCGSSAAAHLEVDVDVVSEDVHSEELAGADLAGVLLIAVGQQMFVHVASAGEHLCTHTQSAGVDTCGPCQGLPPP